jgi:hypothetical protein
MSKRRVCACVCVVSAAVFMLVGPQPTPVPPARAQAQQPSQAKIAPTLLVLNKAENSLALVDQSRRAARRTG